VAASTQLLEHSERVIFITGLSKDVAVDGDNRIGAEDNGIGVSPLASRALLSA
jgi:hypothetical protein